MSDLYRAVIAHKPDLAEPLVLNKGDSLCFERRQTEWDGWLWCSKPGGPSGWVPESWVRAHDDTCVMKRDYNSFELTVQPGVLLDGILAESGWLLAISSGTSGWVPLSCVEPAKPDGLKSLPKKSRDLARGLGFLQAFIGLGAVGGGMALILEPSGANLGIPLELLEGSPFSTYLVPGIVLLTVNGVCSLVGAAASFKRYRYAGELAMALGGFLVVWIMLQVYLFAAFHWLHALYLGLGLLECALGWLLRKASAKAEASGQSF